MVRPLASAGQPGVRFRGWRRSFINGTTAAAPDTPANDRVFGRPAPRLGRAAFPNIGVVVLLECGTRVLLGSAMDACRISEHVLARRLFPLLRQGMLCLANRNFFSRQSWRQARRRGAALRWRLKKGELAPSERMPEDGSCLTTTAPSSRDRRRGRGRRSLPAHMMERSLPAVEASEQGCQLVTPLQDPEAPPP